MSKTFYRKEQYASEEMGGRPCSYSAVNRKKYRQTLRDMVYFNVDVPFREDALELTEETFHQR
jgi:hypothetical protein